MSLMLGEKNLLYWKQHNETENTENIPYWEYKYGVLN